MKIVPMKVVYSDEQKENIMNATKEILDTGMVILGKHTKEFESVCADYTKKKYAVALSNDTAALEITLRYLKKTLPPHKNEVIIPATSFFSCLIAIEDAGFKARIIDISVENGIHSTKNQIASVINEKTACLMTVYCGGLVPTDLEETVAHCREMGVFVLEDAAHCHGSKLNGKPVGSFGDAAGFSFYATKVLNTMEGGMLVTDNEGLAEYAKCMRNYGRIADFQRSLAKEWGNNWRMTEFQCVIGTQQMLNVESIVSERRAVASLYDRYLFELSNEDETLENRGWSILPIATPQMESNFYRYILMLEPDWNKDAVKSYLDKRFDITLPGDTYEATINKQPIFHSMYGHLEFPVAEDYCARHIGLPIYLGMTEEEVKYVCQSFVMTMKEMRYAVTKS